MSTDPKIYKYFNEFMQKAILFSFQSRDGAKLFKELILGISDLLLTAYIPQRKEYNFDSTFFAQARKPLNQLIADAPEKNYNHPGV